MMAQSIKVMLLSCLILFGFGSSAFGSIFDPNHYRRYVESVDAWNYKGESGTWFKLSDGTEWYLLKSCPLIGGKPFAAGTEVFVEASLKDYRIYYSNPKKPHSITAWLAGESKEELNKLAATHEICIKKGGWFTSPKYIQVWELSDGSKWVLNAESPYYRARDKWKIGDKILISAKHNSDYLEWIMINTDTGLEVKTPQDYLDQGLHDKPTMSLRMYLYVTPYNPKI